MLTMRDILMQELETYGYGHLSDDTIDRTVDIIMEIEPMPDTIDGIDVDSIIQAVEGHNAKHLSDVYEVEYDPDRMDWYLPLDGLPDIYLHIGADVEGSDALNFIVRHLADSEWTIAYRVTHSNIYEDAAYFTDRARALETAFMYERRTGCSALVHRVAANHDDDGIVVDEYVIDRII